MTDPARKLIIVASAPYSRKADGLYLDVKFVEGMKLYAQMFEGEVTAVLCNLKDDFPFCVKSNLEDLPFGLTLLDNWQALNKSHLEQANVIMASGDTFENFWIADLDNAKDRRVVFTIEYILETRLQIVSLDQTRSFPKKLYSKLWNIATEVKRFRAFKKSSGLQCNGYPAFRSYGHYGDSILYLDNRVASANIIDDATMNSKCDRVLGKGPVKLIHSGRLETLKGSHDLIPLALELHQRNVPFELRIFGAGSLEDSIKAGIIEHKLQESVFYGGVLDFETELLPETKENADIFVSCHRQSDPSCTYVESMACGVAIVGYDNKMLADLSQDSKSAEVVPMGDVTAMAGLIEKLHKDRSLLRDMMIKSRSFSQEHSFETEYDKRVSHLSRFAQAHS